MFENIFADNGRNSIFNTYEIIRTFFGMRVAFAFALRNFVKCVDASIALISNDIVKAVFAKIFAVTRSIAFGGEDAAYILVAMSGNK